MNKKVNFKKEISAETNQEKNIEKRQDDVVCMRNVFKYFNGKCVLNDISINIKKASVHALLGENGAGKSTLMNILYGVYHADAGSIYINNKNINIKNSNMAIKMGIGMVHQHFMLIQPFTVLQNIILGTEPTNCFGVLNIEKIRQTIKELSERYGLLVDLDSKIEELSVGMQQKVEILKALYRGSDILILDEPTAVLASHEIDELISIIHKLCENGKTIIIITHKLKEIKKVADYCTVIRKGNYIDTVEVGKVTENELANMMVGRGVSLNFEKSEAVPKEEVLAVENLTVTDSKGVKKVDGLSLSVRKGEILGIAGIEGNGQKELVDAIANLLKVQAGTIRVNGQEIQNTSVKNVINKKVNIIPEDRHRRGIVLDFDVAHNLMLKNYDKRQFSKSIFFSFKKINQFVNEIIERFDVRPENCSKLPIRALSGGNQQKVVIAREVCDEPDLLVAVQPTRGLDIGAIEYVHKAIIEQRDSGRAVLLVSLELDEILNISDRIAVIYNGKIVDIVDAKDADEKKIGLLMAGGKI